MTRPHRIDGWRIDVALRPGVARIVSGAETARVVATALAAGGAPRPASLSVILTDDAEIEGLNEAHLGHRGPTDVLSFPLLPPAAFPPHDGGPLAAADDRRSGVPVAFVLPPHARPHLGDVVVSIARAVEQASEGRGGQTGDRRWEPADELRLLLTHGTLHLCGWDHAEPAEETAMRALERRLLGKIPT